MSPEAVEVSTVVVTLDGTPDAERALPTAVFLAEATGARVELLSVAASGAAGELLQHALTRASASVEDHIDEARIAYDFATAERIVLASAPADALPCMATRWPLVGSVARRVLARSDGPVVLVDPDAADVSADGCLLAYVEDLGGTVVLDVAARWAEALGRPLLAATTEDHRRQVGDSALPPDAVRLSGGNPARGVLELQQGRPVALTAVGVPTRPGARFTRASRLATRLVRESRSPVLAVPLR
jgi:nucleotide-binding universal stress UspA family protein